MKLKTIQLVYRREMRDQLRDRRTLVTVLILPILIYPLLGLAMWQISQLSSPETCRIWLIGSNHLPNQDPLIKHNRFSDGLLSETESELTTVESMAAPEHGNLGPLRHYWEAPDVELTTDVREWIRQQLVIRRFDLAILIPKSAVAGELPSGKIPQIQIIQNSTRNASVAAGQRAQAAIQKWTRHLVIKNLGERQINVADVKPFGIGVADVANAATVSAVKWSKTLPLIFVIWALTGAFYPAVDLCAGEKERGTLETLLSSPAARIDIIGGKLLTVMTFSMITAILNFVSLAISAAFVLGTTDKSSILGQHFGLTLPPLHVIPILILALFPIAALFSALAFAVAAFARSSKEGQYYLMPLLMLTFPLLILPMLPGIELGLGTSLVPVSGLILLLHSVIEKSYDQAAIYFGPVCAVTLICCGLAIRWSVHQFNDESILFRSSDHASPWLRIKHFIKHRTEQPTLALAIFCAAVILIAKFFATFAAAPPSDWSALSRQMAVYMFLAIALPAILFAIATTRRPWQSLKLRLPKAWTIAVAGLLAIFLHPLFACLSQWVLTHFPMSMSAQASEAALRDFMNSAPSWLSMVFLLAIAPAVCEELAFRGFILSGLRSTLSVVPAILASSFLFGLAHSVLQQSIITFFVGIALGVLVVRTSSILPCIVFHSIYNSLSLLLVTIDPIVVVTSDWLQKILLVQEGRVAGYQPGAVLICGIVSLLLVLILFRNSVANLLPDWGRPKPNPSPSANA